MAYINLSHYIPVILNNAYILLIKTFQNRTYVQHNVKKVKRIKGIWIVLHISQPLTIFGNITGPEGRRGYPGRDGGKGEKGERGEPGFIQREDGVVLLTGPPGPPVCSSNVLEHTVVS